MVYQVGRTICHLLHLPFSSRFLLNGTGTRFRLNGTGRDGNVTVFVPPTVLCISGSGTCVLFTCDFSESGVLADLMIALLFFWQTQHRSDKGFMTVMCGVSCLHSEQNMVYAAALSPVSSQASL